MAFPKYVTRHRVPQWQQRTTVNKPATGGGCHCGCLQVTVCKTCHEVFHCQSRQEQEGVQDHLDFCTGSYGDDYDSRG
jgi:hypothetical protein